MDFDQLDEAVDAVVGEGHDAFVAQAEDQMRPSSRSIFDGDVEQEVDVLAEVFGDAVDGPDAGDLVDLHGSGRERRDGQRTWSPVPWQEFIEPM